MLSESLILIHMSGVFIDTPSDLFMQSLTWEHHTVKFLVACTPNGAISFISPTSVWSIIDVQLINSSGFLDILKDKPGTSIMADRGFTIKDMLQKSNTDLNLPLFMEGRAQLFEEQVQEGRKIASLRIHVKRAIGRLIQMVTLQNVVNIQKVILVIDIIQCVLVKC